MQSNQIPGATFSGGIFGAGAPSASLTPPVTLDGGTIIADSPVLTLQETWNNVAVTFTGFKINITDTASAVGSLAIDVRVGGTSKFNVEKSGAAVFLANSFAFTTAFNLVSWNNGLIGWSSSGGISTTSAPDAAFARKATKIIEINSGVAGTYVGTALSTGVQTVAQLPAAATAGAGARSMVSDANSVVFNAAAVGGGANIMPVFSNGIGWFIG